jgi:pimeloyl-ACP methyl ester carboxylesterase
MSDLTNNKGYFRCGIPYNRFGCGKRILVIFQGLLFDNKPLTGLMSWKYAEMYDSLEQDYTIYLVSRRTGLPDGCSMKDLADDYAQMIKEEFAAPVDVLGLSTGGSIAQHFAADHPDLVRRLVIHSSAYTLSEGSKEAQLKVARLAKQRKWRAAFAALFGEMLPKGPAKYIFLPIFFLVSLLGASLFGKPDDPSDLIKTIEAEDKHDFKERLHEIKAPTLVIAGAKDPFYTEELFRETSEGIEDARLIICKGKGHPADGKQFKNDLHAFLLES